MEKFNEMFEIIENMQLGEINDELELLKNREDTESSLLRELLKFDLNKRARRQAPDYKPYSIIKNRHGKFEICDYEYGMPVEVCEKYETAVKRKRELTKEYKRKQGYERL